MPEERFTEADLEPTDDERKRVRRDWIDRIGATVAVTSVGIWIGGWIALGASAAPNVFALAPKPFSGDAMGAAFASFDRIALSAAVLLLACEMVRTWVRRTHRRTWSSRARRLLGITIAGLVAYGAIALTPEINRLHGLRVERGVGDQGARLEAMHERAELVAKAQVALGLAVIALHVLTLRRPRPEDDEDDDWAPAPGLPGPDPD